VSQEGDWISFDQCQEMERPGIVSEIRNAEAQLLTTRCVVCLSFPSMRNRRLSNSVLCASVECPSGSNSYDSALLQIRNLVLFFGFPWKCVHINTGGSVNSRWFQAPQPIFTRNYEPCGSVSGDEHNVAG
jgi:hypothetical protein